MALPATATAPHDTHPRSGAGGEPGGGGGITLRVVVFSLLLAMVLGYMIPIIDYKLANTFLGAMHLPPAAVGTLLVLLLFINPVLRLLARRTALTHNEALTVYICCLFSALVPGHGSENFIIPNLVAPFYFASRENNWLAFLQPYLRPWLTPALTHGGQYNRQVVEGWYMGIGNGAPIPWGAWAVPLTFWISFVLVSYGMFACLSVMLRAQWGEHEALAFPLLRLPLAMTQGLDQSRDRAAFTAFFRNPVMWFGFSIAAGIQLIRGLNVYFPLVPYFPLELNTGPLLALPPWNQMGWVDCSIYPIAIGITYLLTTEVSFSLWFFFWFIKLQDIIAYYLGYPPSTLPGGSGFPDKAFTSYQIGSCYLAYVGIILWTARHHLGHIAARALGRTKVTPQEASEALSYPVAFWGFWACFGLMVAATCCAGVRPDIALALWLSYLIFAIGLSRVAVEGGLLALQHQTLPLGPISHLLHEDANVWLSRVHGVVPAALFQSGMVYHMRAFIAPSFLHSFKLAHDQRIPARPLLLLISAVVLLSVGVSWVTIIHMGYRDGGALQFGMHWWARDGSRTSAYFIDGLTREANRPHVAANWCWLGLGALLTVAMMWMRSRFLWFPFHPIGYLMSLTYPIQTMWVSVFIGWLAKVLISRYGGADSYRKATPFFLGLALGDVAMILVWLLVDAWQGRTGHQLLPG